jgi:hypothetical protein
MNTLKNGKKLKSTLFSEGASRIKNEAPKARKEKLGSLDFSFLEESGRGLITDEMFQEACVSS